MILQGFPGKRKILQRQGGKGGDGWKCTALSDAADFGCGESIDDLMTSWKCRGAERLVLTSPQRNAFLATSPMPFWTPFNWDAVPVISG